MGDGAYLFDPLGNIRASMVYPCRGACSDPLAGRRRADRRPDAAGASRSRSTNLTAGALDLDGYVLKSPPLQLPLRRRLGAPAGRLDADPDRRRPEDDAPLSRSWGFARPILRNAGDVVRLATYTDITLACTAWGDKSC